MSESVIAKLVRTMVKTSFSVPKVSAMLEKVKAQVWIFQLIYLRMHMTCHITLANDGALKQVINQ